MTGFTEFAASLGLTELQLSLGLIGFSLLVLVMIYNAMRIRKVEVEDASNHLDEATIAEPGFSSIDAVIGRSEPTLGADTPIATPVVSVPKIDPLIDCVVALRLPESISGDEILGHLIDWPKNSLFTWMCEGLNAASEWESVVTTGAYTELQVAIQLANRTGPIGIVDLSDFVSKAQALANALDAEIDLPPVNEVIEEAKNLDQFAAQSDIQLGITVIPKEGMWNLSTIQSVAAKAGFLLSRDGRDYQRVISNVVVYKLVADQANFLRDDLSKANIQYVTLLLDLPRVPYVMTPFKIMLDDAKLLAESLNGNLVDDAGRPLVDEAVFAITAQLAEIYQAMDQQGMPAGSITASRLFS
ncbi:MAG: hypothetical protein RLY99_523 [Pseudomonadota bacterium]|jgi:hypothetical protein